MIFQDVFNDFVPVTLHFGCFFFAATIAAASVYVLLGKLRLSLVTEGDVIAASAVAGTTTRCAANDEASTTAASTNFMASPNSSVPGNSVTGAV